MVDTEVKEHCAANCHQARMTSSVLAAFLLPLVVSSMAVDLPYFCSFEDSGLCGMEHREGGDFTWTRYNQSTPSDGTGPEKAAEGGWYMYIESSDGEGRVKGDKAYIQTPAVEYTGDVCIRFQYHMDGQHIGRLVVFVDTRGENSNPAFSKSGHQNITWQAETVNVEGFKAGDRVVFMADYGGGYQGDIAIDDLHIANGTCQDCQVNNGGCDHICRPQGTWTICSCHEGYIRDSRRCIPESPTSTTPMRSTSPSTIPSRSSSSTTNRPDPPMLSNTTSTVHRTTASSQPPSMTTSRMTGQQTDFPLWQVILAVILVVLAVIALAVGIVLYLKRRTMASQAKEPDRVYYANDAALPTRPAGDVTKPADEAPYEDVECPRPVTASYNESQMSPPRSDPEDPNPGGYEDLVPYETHARGPYDLIM